MDVWPTLFVLAPRDGKPVLKWLGSATAAQLDELLTAAARSAGAPRRERGADEALARADRAHAEGRLEEGIAAYRDALRLGGARWASRPRAVEALVLAQAGARDLQACAETARAEAPRLPRDTAFAAVAATGLSCATEAPPDAPWRDGAIDALEPLTRAAVRLPRLLADDRAGLYESLVEARTARGDEVGARGVAERWWSFLERERTRASSAEARASLDSYRVAAAEALGDPARALPPLEQSERDLPGDYNPPARRARVLREVGRLPEARAAAERALAKAYGPRKLKVYQLAATIMDKQGDRAALAATLDEALAYADGLPPSQRDEKLASMLRAQLAALRGE